ncbi:MAG: redoxin domain-containing protein, partial [Bacteroidota bacterium]
HPDYISASIIKGSMDITIPDPESEMTEEAESDWRYDYYKQHFFDNINFNDGRLIRTPVYQNRLDRYMERMIIPVPDTVIKEVDRILKMAEVNDEIFRFSLIHLLNSYAKSKIVGMDAVIVHLIDYYYANGRAPWTTEESLTKLKKQAKELRPLLIGKKAPNISMTLIDTTAMEPTTKVQLYDIAAEFTILYLWDPKCGHCNKVAPDLVEFWEAHKNQDIKIFSICTKDKKTDLCRETIKEKGFSGLINTMAIEDRELYYRLKYAVKSTPIVYVLDENKVIQSKGIGPKQLTEVIELLRQRKAEEQTN